MDTYSESGGTSGPLRLLWKFLSFSPPLSLSLCFQLKLMCANLATGYENRQLPLRKFELVDCVVIVVLL